jgi:tetratricopeptide (TPR) repeat protein
MSLVNDSADVDSTVAFVTLETTRTLESIISLNQIGVSYFNRGEYSDAMFCFKEATFASKTFLNGIGRKSHGECLRCCAKLVIVASPVKRHTPPPASVGDAQIASDISSVNHLMYLRPFEISVVAKDCNDTMHKEFLLGDEQLLFSQLSITLIFNLALTHHVMAVLLMTADSHCKTTSTTASAARYLLFKARGLYSVACSVAYSLPQEDCYLDKVWTFMLSLFVKAILNNLGHCYAALGDATNSVQCFELLLKSIMLFQHDHIYGRLSEEDRRYHNDAALCFWDSIMFLILKDPGLAPSA